MKGFELIELLSTHPPDRRKQRSRFDRSVVLMEVLAGAIDSKAQQFVYEISRNFTIISVYQLSNVNGLLAARS